MPVQSQRRVKGKLLQRILELQVGDSDAFAGLRFCQPEALQRLLGKRYTQLVELDVEPHSMALEGLQQLSLRLFLDAFDQNNPALVEGIPLLWYRYLRPLQDTARTVPAMNRVLRHCARLDNLTDFLRSAQTYARQARPEKELNFEAIKAEIERLFSVVPATDAVAPKHWIRTPTNHLYRALEALASCPELDGLVVEEPALLQAAPPLPPEEAEIAGMPAAVNVPDVLSALAAYLLRECDKAPSACGYHVPIEQTVARSVSVRPLRGQWAYPDVSLPEPEAIQRMSSVLVGVPGSGRTTFLKRIAYHWARAWQAGAPLAIYVNAQDFAVYARNRRSVYELVARQVYPEAGSAYAQRAELSRAVEPADQAGRLLWLVDDVDRLSPADQADVVGQLAFSPAVMATTVPWEADRTAQMMPQPHLAVMRLSDLSLEAQREMLGQFAKAALDQSVDIDLATYVLREIPDLAALPLGVMSVYAQAVEHASSRVQIVQRAITEWLERADLPKPTFAGDWQTLPPVMRSLRMLAQLGAADIFLEQNVELFIPRTQFEAAVQAWQSCRWDDLLRTRLVEPDPDGRDACRFVNQDVLACLSAQSDVTLPARDSNHLPPPLMQLAQRIQGFRDVLWEMRER